MRPTKGELRVQSHRFSEIFLCTKEVGRSGLECVSQPAQVVIVGLGVVGRFGGDDLLFLTAEFRSQLISDDFSYFALNGKDVGQFAIKGISPKMRIGSCFD